MLADGVAIHLHGFDEFVEFGGFGVLAVGAGVDLGGFGIGLAFDGLDLLIGLVIISHTNNRVSPCCGGFAG